MASSSRLLRPLWRDRRLAGSAALIACAALAGSVLTSNSHTVSVYQADSTVLPGTSVGSAALTLVDVPPAIAEAYATASEVESGAVFVDTVRKGELVPYTALAELASEDVRIVLDLAGPVPSAAQPGSRVTLWRIDSATATGEGSGAAELTREAQLVSASGADALTNEAELLLPDAAVGPVLEAMGANASFMVTVGGAK